MTPRDLRNIHTARNSCRDALPSSCVNMDLKLPSILPADGEASSWSLLPSLLSLLSGSTRTVQPENTYSHILQGDRSGLRKPKTRISIITISATTSVHLPKPVSTDLIINSHIKPSLWLIYIFN